MKNRKLLLIVSLVLAMTMSLGGTLAYLTDQDADVNTMVLGNVKIVQNEQERVKDADGKFTSELQAYTDGQMMLPAVYDVEGQADPEKMDLAVGEYGIKIRQFPNYMDKIVTVTNTGNTNAYVRTIIAVPAGTNEDSTDNNVSDQWLHFNCVSDSDTSPKNNGWHYGTPDNEAEYPTNYANHYIFENVELNNAKYDITIVTNTNVLGKGETTGPNLVGLYLDNDVDYKDGKYYAKDKEGKLVEVWNQPEMKVYVLSQAVQADGFENAWIAFENAFPLGADEAAQKAKLVEWFESIGVEGGIDIDSPGSQNDTNNPPKIIRASTSEDLKNALATKTEGGEVVKVIMSSDIDATLETSGTYGNVYGNVVLDMNGHTLNDKSGNIEVLLRTREGGKLTITGNGKVYSENHNKWMLYTDSNSDIIVENGTFVKAPYEWGADCGYDGCTGGDSHTKNGQNLNPLICGKGVVTVYDGYFDCGILNPDYVEANSRPVVHDCMYPTINLGINSGDDHVVIYGGTWVTANPVAGDDNPAGSTNEGNATATEKCFFLYGQEEYDVLPAGYTVVEKTLADGRTAYVYSYSE